MNNNIRQAITVLNSGGVIIFPTDTVYGIGCRLDNPEAIERVFTIRNRPLEKAVLAVVDSVAMAQRYLEPILEEVKTKLIEKFWPDNLTIILPCLEDKVPAIARANGKTLGVRQTSHSFLLEILKEIQVPLIAPSANFAGMPTPKNFSELDPKLVELVDYVLEGPTGGHMPSTVIDCSTQPWRIVREGAAKVSI